MAETKISKNQTGIGIFTTESLIGGSNVTIAQKAMPIIDANTLGLYHLDGNLKDEITGNNAYYWSSVSYTDGGKFGKGITNSSFSYFNFVLPSGQAYVVSGTYTFDFWAKPTSSSSVCGLNLQGKNSGINGIIQIKKSSFSLEANLSGTGSNTGTLSYPSGVEFTENVWHHVAYVLDGVNSKVYLFLDGKNVYSATKTANVNPIGVMKSWEHSNCYMDEIRLSNVARWTSDFTPYDMPYSAGGDPLYEVSADVSGALTSIQGYSSSDTQVLKNINGVLTWVTEA